MNSKKITSMNLFICFVVILEKLLKLSEVNEGYALFEKVSILSFNFNLVNENNIYRFQNINSIRSKQSSPSGYAEERNFGRRYQTGKGAIRIIS